MASEYFLDTNIAIYFFQGLPNVTDKVRQHTLRYLTLITAAELLYGAKRSARREQNLRIYEQFLSRFHILYADRRTLDVYSDLRAILKEMGRPLPLNDVWQAALACQHGAVLVTNDKHFQGIPGLLTENWAE